jgi:hypothetical protein
MQKICLDAGILSIYFSKDCSIKVTNLMKEIQRKKYDSNILKPVLCEAFYHLCKIEGKENASIKIISFLRKSPISQIDLEESLILLTGILKCQHRTTLSYIDCMSIAFCLNEKAVFHTTEKMIKKIQDYTIQKLKIETYSF